MPRYDVELDRAEPPIAIGGIGGSGTRLIAHILLALGFSMGSDLNDSLDNQWFTLLFKRAELWDANKCQEDFARAVDIFRHVMTNRNSLTPAQVDWIQRLAAADARKRNAQWLRCRVASLLAAPSQRRCSARWGWKEPNTHIFIDRLQDAFPGMKYIHVMRNGLDMAYSANQNQLGLWGPLMLGSRQCVATAWWSLRYWCVAHQRVIAFGRALGDRFLLLNFDSFCASPQTALHSLLQFLNLSIDDNTQNDLMHLIHRPDSTGRFKQFGLRLFDPHDVAYVASLGFDTRCSRGQDLG